VLGRGLAGSSNLHQIDAATFRASLHSVVTQAFAELDPDSIELSAACFGLAGVSSSKAHEQAQAVIAELKLSPVATISILTDAHIALTGGLAGAPGIVLLAGTGSACFGNDAEGKLCRTGGWGSIADDGGSGGWIGRQALECALRQADGRRSGEALKNAIFAQLKINSLDDIIQRLHGESIQWNEIAALCPTVVQLAQSGDVDANQIVQRAIDELVALVRATAAKLDLNPIPLVLMGGLIDNDSFFTQRFTQQMHQAMPEINLQPPLLPPVAGAVLEAFKSGAHHLPSRFASSLHASLSKAGALHATDH
jgi:N-acetylglucosamine kinase-like BadF-type ATPase